MRCIVLACLFLLNTTHFALASSQHVLNATHQQNLSLTIYKDGSALVNDTRFVTLNPGDNLIQLYEVPSQLIEESLYATFNEDQDVFSIESIKPSKAITYNDLLQHSMGHIVQFKTPQGTIKKGRLIGQDNGLIILSEEEGHIYTNITPDIIFEKLPENLSSVPWVRLHCKNKKESSKKGTLSLYYLAKGLSWKPEYIAIVDQNGMKIDFSGMIRLENKSGVDFRNAHIALMGLELTGRSLSLPKSSLDADQERLRKFLPLLLYRDQTNRLDLSSRSFTLSRQLTIENHEQKKFHLLSAHRIQGVRHYWLRIGPSYLKDQTTKTSHPTIRTMVSFLNQASNNTGIALPRGNLHIYQQDTRGHLFFREKTELDHTPVNGRIALPLGDAKGISAQLTQTDHKVLGNKIIEAGYKIDIENEREIPVEVKIVAVMKGDWQVIRENFPHIVENVNNLVWTVNLKEQGTTTLSYRVRLRQTKP